jgi:RND family efflux transporter MFP subunit
VATTGTTISLASLVTTSSAPAALDDSSGASGTGSEGGTATGAVSSTITAETIVADQAEIDLAEADLAIAQQQLTLATLTSPIAGTVAAVSMSVGDTVDAASTTAVITVIGDDGFVVDSTATLANVGKLAVGQTVAITLASTDAELTGVVSSIGVLNVSTDSATPSYDVIIAIDATDASLLNGASAQVAVSVAAEDSVLTVPTSAVHRSGTTYSVDVLSNGSAQPTAVEIGAMGSERTEITSGLAEGDAVVLADLNADVLGGGTSTESTGLTGLGGGSNTTGTGGAPTFSGGGAGFDGGGFQGRPAN